MLCLGFSHINHEPLVYEMEREMTWHGAWNDILSACFSKHPKHRQMDLEVKHYMYEMLKALIFLAPNNHLSFFGF